MADALIYFDGSGLGGTIPLASWQALGNWADTLPPAGYQSLLHLWEQGWEDNLAGLADELTRALRQGPPGAAKDAAAELLDVLESRADSDGAVAVTADIPADETEAEAAAGQLALRAVARLLGDAP